MLIVIIVRILRLRGTISKWKDKTKTKSQNEINNQVIFGDTIAKILVIIYLFYSLRARK